MSQKLEAMIQNLSDKVDVQNEKVNDRLNNIDQTMAKQEVNLDVHMRRADNLEVLVEQNNKAVMEEIRPLRKHVNMVEGALKLLGVVSLLLGIARLLGLI